MVQTGLDVVLSDHIDELRRVSVGIVANHASVTSDLVHISDALHMRGVKIAALFGPEHGARGDVADGEAVGNATDDKLGVPVYSLYGETRSPTERMLAGIDLVICDLQDVGARFYTFLYTMANVMAGCGEHGVLVWVLDRPNPISGLRPDGPVLEPEFASFIGLYPIPMRHGLTVGELARLFCDSFGVTCKLRVIQMRGWIRDMWFEQTGLPWVPPSPNMPLVETAAVYPGLCLIEGTNVSEGRGTVRPFETFGAPWVDPAKLKSRLLEYELPGAAFREAYFTPTASKFEGERCAGVQVYVTDRGAFRAPLTGTAVVHALYTLYPERFEFRPPSPVHGKRFFDLLAGNSRLREAIEAGTDPWRIAESWDAELAAFEPHARAAMFY